MWNFNQPYFEDRLIASDQAWRRFDQWMAARKQIGVWFVSKNGSVRMSGIGRSARNARLQLHGSSARAAFNLSAAQFTYGPFQVFPRWPMGPMVQLDALQAFLSNGDWLVLAEGFSPEVHVPRAIPA